MRVNGRVAGLGDRIAPGDLVEIGPRTREVREQNPRHRTLVYHKPEGQVTTRRDPEGRPTVFDKLPPLRGQRWVAIGRLDLNTAGLLLLTTDGELANRMMHPAGRVDREYLCRIRGQVDDAQIRQLLDGVKLDDGIARFSDLVRGEATAGHTWYTVTIMEGRNREVRRLWEAVGVQVARLKRVRFGPVFLPASLRPGQFKEISGADHRILREDAGLPGRTRELVLVPAGGDTRRSGHRRG